MRSLELKTDKDAVGLSRLGFGTGSVGTALSYEEAATMLDCYREAGGNCIDTARMYGKGASEEVIGHYLARRDCRHGVILSTKGGFPQREDMHSSRLCPTELQKDLTASLKALGTEYIDLYFLHRDDPDYPVEELMPFLDGLVRSGKIRFLGASNWCAERIGQANRFAAENNLTPFSVSQIQWSLAEATPAMWGDDTIVCMNDDEAAFYERTGIPVMAFTPLTRGFFSKALEQGMECPALEPYSAFKTSKNRKRALRLSELCRRYHATPTQICHAYLTSGSPQGVAVLGAKKQSHLEDALAGADIVLTTEDIKFLRADDLY